MTKITRKRFHKSAWHISWARWALLARRNNKHTCRPPNLTLSSRHTRQGRHIPEPAGTYITDLFLSPLQPLEFRRVRDDAEASPFTFFKVSLVLDLTEGAGGRKRKKCKHKTQITNPTQDREVKVKEADKSGAATRHSSISKWPGERQCGRHSQTA